MELVYFCSKIISLIMPSALEYAGSDISTFKVAKVKKNWIATIEGNNGPVMIGFFAPDSDKEPLIRILGQLLLSRNMSKRLTSQHIQAFPALISGMDKLRFQLDLEKATISSILGLFFSIEVSVNITKNHNHFLITLSDGREN